MKKSLSLLLAIALVVSMFATVASADNHTTQDKFDALVEAGIFTGYPDGSAGLEREMTRAEFATVLARVTKAGDTGTKTYADVAAGHWAKGYIAAVSDKGYMNGTSATKFSPSLKVTTEQMATTVVRFLGLEPSTAEVSGNVSAWAKGYVAAALANNLIPEAASYKTNATRGALVEVAFSLHNMSSITVTSAVAVDANTVEFTFSDGGKVTVPLTTPLVAGQATDVKATYKDREYTKSVTLAAAALDVTATGAKELTLKFNQAIDTTKATVAVKRGVNTISASAPVWSADKMTATVELASKMIAGTYDVTVSGITATALTDSVTVEAEKVAEIQIPSDSAPISAADPQKLEIGYKVVNQYGEDITRTTNITASSSGGAAEASNGTVTVTGGANFVIGTPVSVTLINPESTIVATKALTVAAVSKVADISVKSIYNAEGKTLNADSTGTDFYLLVDAKDQYGNAVTALPRLKAETLVTVSNPTVAGIENLTNNKADYVNVTVNNETVPALRLSGNPEAGTSVVTLIAEGSGRSTTFTVNVGTGLKADTVVFGDPGLVAAGETVNVPVTVTDLAGNEITDITVLNAANGVDVNLSAGAVDQGFKKVNNQVVYQFTAPGAATTVSLTAISANSKVAVKSVTVRDEANPRVVTGLDAAVDRLVFLGEDVEIQLEDLIVEDQYGRVMSDDDVVADLGTTVGSYRVVASDAGTTAITLDGHTTLDQASDILNVKGSVKGSEGVTFTLERLTAVTPADDWDAVSGSAATISFRTVELAELSNFAVEAPNKVYFDTNAAYDVTLKVVGLLSDGRKVTLPASAYNVTSNSALIDASPAGVVSVNAGAVADDFGSDKELTGTVTATIRSTGAEVTGTVTASNAAPVLTKFAADSTTISLDADVVGDPNVVTIADIEGLITTIEDQYAVAGGIDAAGLITFADDGAATNVQARVTFSNLDNNAGADLALNNNGLATASLSGVDAGDTFTVRVTAAGKTIEFTVTAS